MHITKPMKLDDAVSRLKNAGMVVCENGDEEHVLDYIENLSEYALAGLIDQFCCERPILFCDASDSDDRSDYEWGFHPWHGAEESQKIGAALREIGMTDAEMVAEYGGASLR